VAGVRTCGLVERNDPGGKRVGFELRALAIVNEVDGAVRCSTVDSCGLKICWYRGVWSLRTKQSWGYSRVSTKQGNAELVVGDDAVTIELGAHSQQDSSVQTSMELSAGLVDLSW
jgi:hypothetical protein